MPMDDFQRGCMAMLNYIYNTSGVQFAKDIFPDGVEPYQDEKADVWAQSPARAMAFLDEGNKLKLFAIAGKRYLSLLALLLLASCAGMSAAETTGAAAAGVGALVGFVDALRPMLTPEQSAQLTSLAGTVESVTQATNAALGQVAEAVGRLKVEQEAGWTSGEVAGGTGAVATAGVIASRMISMMKHRGKTA